MSGYWEAPDDYAQPIENGHGSAHSVSSEVTRELPEHAVRRIAEEVTGKSFPLPIRTIGFLR